MDRITAFFATNLLADSASQRQFLINEKTVPAKKIAVLASGSVNGVNLERFKPNQKARTSVRSTLRISQNDCVILFLGRLKRDKGVLDLADIIDSVVSEEPKTFFLFVGPDEEYLRKEIQKRASKSTKRISLLEYTKTPEDYLAASDILCLPSYREGFGSVIIEGAACGIPTVASRIYGITDAVVDNVTGLLFQSGDTKDLKNKLLKLVQSPKHCERLGKAARQRAACEFSENVLTDALAGLYNNLFSQ
jgi:glycosyltransferase involved in cell wall biosynthesis